MALRKKGPWHSSPAGLTPALSSNTVLRFQPTPPVVSSLLKGLWKLRPLSGHTELKHIQEVSLFQDHLGKGDHRDSREPDAAVMLGFSLSSVHSFDSINFTIDLGPALISDTGQYPSSKFFLPLRPSLGMEENEAGLPCGVPKCSSYACYSRATFEGLVQCSHAGPRYKNLQPG